MKSLSAILRTLALLTGVVLLAAACGSDTDVSTPAATTAAAGGDSGASDDGTLPDLGGRAITVAVENAYLPFNYIDAATGEPAGWDYAAIGEICNRINCTPEFVTFSWEPMIQAVSDGQFDMAADGITITDERAQVVDFSQGYINIDQRIMVAIDNEEITSADDLANGDYVVGTQTGTTNYETALALVGQDRITAYEQFAFAVQALIAGDVDAVIIDETAGQGYVGENADAVKLVGDSLSSDSLGFVFPKDSDLVASFDAAISEMKADGTLEALAQEFFTGAFTITYDDIAEPVVTTEATG